MAARFLRSISQTEDWQLASQFKPIHRFNLSSMAALLVAKRSRDLVLC
jgi:hypothetical protein